MQLLPVGIKPGFRLPGYYTVLKYIMGHNIQLHEWLPNMNMLVFYVIQLRIQKSGTGLLCVIKQPFIFCQRRYTASNAAAWVLTNGVSYTYPSLCCPHVGDKAAAFTGWRIPKVEKKT
jgi:hypothetical protein